MPDTPSFLKRDRLGYVGSHSFVLLIGMLSLTSAISYFHNRDAPGYKAIARIAGPYFQDVSYAFLAAGGLSVILGLVLLWLPVEALGHSLICSGILMNGVMVARMSGWGFDALLTEFILVFTVGCILFRLWALFEALRRARRARV